MTPIERRHGERSTLRSAAFAMGFALLMLSVLDLVVTEFGIRHLGAVEINPIMARLLGTHWALALKVGIPLVVMALATRVRSWKAVDALRVVVALYLAAMVFTLGQVALIVTRW